MQKKDMGLGIISVAFGAWMFYTANRFESGPAFWPKIVAVGIIILGVIIFLTALVQTRRTVGAPVAEATEKSPKAKPQYLKVLAVIIVLAVYYFGFQYFSYTISTFLLIAITAFILGYRNWKIMIPTSVIVSIVLYIAFTRLFGIHFPAAFY